MLFAFKPGYRMAFLIPSGEAPEILFPEQVTLLLVVHPAQRVRQVRVVRRVHTVEFYQPREQQARAEAHRYKEALEHVENEPQVQGGLRGIDAVYTHHPPPERQTVRALNLLCRSHRLHHHTTGILSPWSNGSLWPRCTFSLKNIVFP